MTQEETKTTWIDLSARVMYHPEIQVTNTYLNQTYNEVLTMANFTQFSDVKYEVKPFLRPMSSMTDGEKEELRQEHIKDEKLFAECLTKAANGDSSMRGKVVPHFAVDWCNKNHFDYRGLIPMGLALETPEGMYETK